MTELSLGGGEAHQDIEYHNPDFAYIPRHRGAPAAAQRVPHFDNDQYILLKRVKKEAQKKVGRDDRLWIKWKGKNPYTHMVLEHPPSAADGKGWRIYADFSKLEDSDCEFSKRPVTDWTNPKDGKVHKNAMRQGSGDRAMSPAEIAQLPANLTSLHMAMSNWGYWGTHAHREQVVRIRKEMTR